MALKSFNDPNSTEARQHLLDRRCERKHKKRHRTLKRSRRIKAARKAKGVARAGEQRKARSRFLAKARAYWAGEADGHP